MNGEFAQQLAWTKAALVNRMYAHRISFASRRSTPTVSNLPSSSIVKYLQGDSLEALSWKLTADSSIWRTR